MVGVRTFLSFFVAEPFFVSAKHPKFGKPLPYQQPIWILCQNNIRRIYSLHYLELTLAVCIQDQSSVSTFYAPVRHRQKRTQRLNSHVSKRSSSVQWEPES